MHIAFLGAGPMGAPMARRLLEAGHGVTVWNRTSSRAEALGAQGAKVARTPAEAAEGAELVFTSLANDEAVREVTLGARGLAEGLRAGAIHASTSTISVALARELEEAHGARGQHMVSATVLGRTPAAESGQLYVMAAGAPAAVAQARPALEVLGQRVFELGDAPWKANLVKLCANFMIFSTIEQMSEIFALSEKAGVAPGLLFEVLTGSFCSAPVHRNYGKLMLEEAFSPPGGSMALGAKDNELILQAGALFSVPLPIASLLRDRFIAAFANGDGELDFAALSRRARADAGLG